MNPNRAKWMVALVLSLCGSMAQAVTVNAFLEEAAQQSVFQTEGAKVALQKSQMPEVKDFANQMISKNAQLYGKLKALGEQLHMNVPDEASLAGKAKQMRLESRDESFDRIYIDSQAETLEQKVFLFKKEAMSSEKPELKKFAEAALPDILKQEQTVKSLQDKLKPSAGKLTPANP
jgi:putative membrane protein